MSAVADLAPTLGVRRACRELTVSRASYYRAQALASPPPDPAPPPRPSARPSPRALSAGERAQALALLHSDRFVDLAPAAVYAILLDEGTYLCSERTLYRLLAAQGETGDRRNPRRHPVHPVPQLVARAPNEVWSWDITKLPGPVKGSHYCLYVLLDLFSRSVVSWLVAERELAWLAELLLATAAEQEGIAPDQLTIHSDRGAPMTAKSVAVLLADLGVAKSLSRPHVSNDNPYSESQFKTLKYRPDFPARFGSLEDARAHCRRFFTWYNTEHRHSGIGLLPPLAVHTGQAAAIQARRTTVLEAAYTAHPERFVRGVPRPPRLPTEAWINPPMEAGAP
jgi:putative transposase